MTSKGRAMQVLAIEASPRQKAKGIALTGVKVPQKWLLPAADGTKPFTPVIDQAAYLRWQATYPTTETLKLMSVLPVFTGGFLLQAFTGNILLDVVGWTTVALAAGGGIFGSLRSERRAIRRRNAIIRHAYGALDDWLLARYNIKLKKIASNPQGDSFLLSPQPTGASMVFIDEQQRWFRLVHGVQGLYVEDHKPEADYYAPAGTGEIIPALSEPDSKELAALLTGDAKTLHERMLKLLEALDQRQLDSEAHHVVKRVQEDLRETLVINRDLQKIHGDDEESRAELAAVLSALNDELDEVLTIERKAVRDLLSTQLGYVKGRRRHISALQLPAPAQQLVEESEIPKAVRP